MLFNSLSLLILLLCTLQGIPVPLISAMGQRAMTWQLEATSVCATRDGGESAVTIQQTVVSLEIVALIPTYVMVMGSVCGTKASVRISPDVCVIPAGIYRVTVSFPRD